VFLLTEGLTIAANEFLGVDPFLKVVAGTAIVFMSFALVGLATGLGACYPRFGADNPNQVAGSSGGVAFMIAAVMFVLVMIVMIGWPSSLYLWHRVRRAHLSGLEQLLMSLSFAGAVALSLTTWLLSMRAGVRALQRMDRTPV
jgi:hypothetical protein